MNIWLTTKNGFLGLELSQRLKKKYKLFSTDRNSVDLLNSSSVDDFIEKNKIDIIIHNAIKGGRRNKIDTPEIVFENILMFENLAKNSNKIFKLINFDSAASFDRKRNIENFKEEELGKSIPTDFYGFSKMNIALRSYMIKNAYNLRIFNCFGPLETPDRMTKFNIIQYINNKELIVHKNKYMDIFYIDDLYKVLEYYLNNENLPKDINLVYKNKNTLIDIANIINNLDKQKSKIILEDQVNDFSYTGDSSTLDSLNINLFGVEYGINYMFKDLKEKI